MTEEIRILGLDISASETGIAACDGSVTTFSPKIKIPLIRLGEFRDFFNAMLSHPQVPLPNMAVIENYAFGAKFQRETLAEIHGIVRLAFYDAQVPFALIAPAQLKKYATGNGNAGKDEMVYEAARHGCPAEKGNNNAVDAWWLRNMALTKFDLPGAPDLPKAQRDVVNKVEWPMRFKYA